MSVILAHFIPNPPAELAVAWAHEFEQIGQDQDRVEAYGPSLPLALTGVTLVVGPQVAVGLATFDNPADAQASEAALRDYWATLAGVPVAAGVVSPLWARERDPRPTARMIWISQPVNPEPGDPESGTLGSAKA